MRARSIALALLAAVVGFHQPEAPLDPWLRALAERPGAPRFVPDGGARPGAARGLRVATAGATRDAEIPVFLIGDPSGRDLDALGIDVGARAGDVTSARVPASALGALERVRGLRGAALARPFTWSLETSVPAVHAEAVRTRNGSAWSGATGRGVLVGIADSGVDPRHPDFRNPDGSTRLLAYWDQNDPTGPPPRNPAGDTLFAYGTAWTPAELETSPPADPEGHGTHVAGIAAGNGRGSDVDSLRYRRAGLAPAADLVAVALDPTAETSILDGVEYILSVAGARGEPVVVNLSLGTHFGPHDGTSPLDLGLDALLGPGRLAVAAAGNEGEDRIHAQLELRAGSRDSVTCYIGGYGAACGEVLALEGFYRDPDHLAVTVVSPSGTRWGPYGPGEAEASGPDGSVFIVHGPYPGGSGNVEVGILLWDGGACGPPPAPGTWTLVFEDRNAGAGTGEVDLWIAFSTMRDPAGNEPYWLRGHEAGEEVSSPATAKRVVAVGSFNTKRCWSDSSGVARCTTLMPSEWADPGRLTYFSSRGPTRDGRRKPDVVAPGFLIASSRSHTLDPDSPFALPVLLDPDREHVVAAGTSASAPHVTGALALLLARNPALTPEEAISRLRLTSRRDGDTGAVWNPSAGNGKLDVAALIDSLDPGAVPPLIALGARPNPTRGAIALGFRLDAGTFPAHIRATVFDLSGRRVRTLSGVLAAPGEGSLAWDGRDDAGREAGPGWYGVRVAVGGHEATVTLVRLP
jgi:subtilisin family serine protease